MLHAALPFLMLVAVTQTTSYHQLEAQHLKQPFKTWGKAEYPPKHLSRRRARDLLAVFLQVLAHRIVQERQHRLRRPAKPGGRLDDRPVDENGVGEHDVGQLIVAPFGLFEPVCGLTPRDIRKSKGEHHATACFLIATRQRLRAFGEVISHFLRKGKLGLKFAIKIPFFGEIEVSFETGWSRRRRGDIRGPLRRAFSSRH
ncbi:hypothetical protein ABID26_004606 [Mesorhizobium shonense]|uniref:Secreted protein n=1 Tax=Mesorhizobium shonense TaxID=1209948 RepID=A0ABV2HXT9_9HYPH